MDQVFFAFKRAHHATLKYTRPLLREFGLTPARFDVLVAAGIDATQVGIRRILGLAPATISEMLGRMEELGLITRSKLGRTREVTLTAKGKLLFHVARRACVENGAVATVIDQTLAENRERESIACRGAAAAITTLIRRAFGDGAKQTLYTWRRDGCAEILFAA